MSMTRAQLWQSIDELSKLAHLPDEHVGWKPKGFPDAEGLTPMVPYLGHEIAYGYMREYFGAHFSVIAAPFPTSVQVVVSVIDPDTGQILVSHGDVSDIKHDKGVSKQDKENALASGKPVKEFEDSDAAASSRAFARAVRFYSNAFYELWTTGAQIKVSAVLKYSKPVKPISWTQAYTTYYNQGWCKLKIS